MPSFFQRKLHSTLSEQGPRWFCGSLLFLGCLWMAPSLGFAERLSLDSNPSGADILINGTRRGQTPQILSLAAGQYHVELRKSGFLTWTTYLRLPQRAELKLRALLEKKQGGEVSIQTVEPGKPKPTPLEPKLKRRGLIVVKSVPSGISVWSHGKKLGVTPLLHHLPLGTHTLFLRQAGYEVVRKQVIVRADKSALVKVKMAAIGMGEGGVPKIKGQGEAQLVLLSKPAARVYMNGRPMGKTPMLSAGLRPGRYKLRLVRSRYQVYERWLQLYPGQQRTLKVLLVPLGRRKAKSSSRVPSRKLPSPRL